jgi:hypothetical protein
LNSEHPGKFIWVQSIRCNGERELPSVNFTAAQIRQLVVWIMHNMQHIMNVSIFLYRFGIDQVEPVYQIRDSLLSHHISLPDAKLAEDGIQQILGGRLALRCNRGHELGVANQPHSIKLG